MNGHVNVEICEPNRSQSVNTCHSFHSKCLKIFNFSARRFSTIFYNRAFRLVYLLLCITIVLCSMLQKRLDHHEPISIKRSHHNTGAFLSDTRVPRRPTLAIVMTITSDLMNGSIAQTSVANKKNYVKQHGYAFILDAAIDQTRSGPWARIVTIHSVMHARPDIEWFWCLDIDAFILEKQIDIYDQVTKKYQWGLDRKLNITKDILMSDDCNQVDSFNDGCESALPSLQQIRRNNLLVGKRVSSFVSDYDLSYKGKNRYSNTHS